MRKALAKSLFVLYKCSQGENMKLKFKDIGIRIFQTLLFWRLEFVGVGKFNLLEKRSVHFQGGGDYFFFKVESEDKKYLSIIQVFTSDYDKFQKGSYYKEMGIIKDKRNENYLLLTKHTQAKDSIVKECLKAILKSILILGVMFMAAMALIALGILIVSILRQILMS